MLLIICVGCLPSLALTEVLCVVLRVFVLCCFLEEWPQWSCCFSWLCHPNVVPVLENRSTCNVCSLVFWPLQFNISANRSKGQHFIERNLKEHASHCARQSIELMGISDGYCKLCPLKLLWTADHGTWRVRRVRFRSLDRCTILLTVDGCTILLVLCFHLHFIHCRGGAEA